MRNRACRPCTPIPLWGRGCVVRAACAGTKRDGEPCTVSVPRGERYCYNHNPDYAEERKQSASRAATAKHSSMGKELREVRELILELLGVLLSDQLPVRVRKELQNVVQLLQCHSFGHQRGALSHR